VLDHSRGEDMRRVMNLRVLTFDTCQGLEREIVMYSLVETADRRLLNYIFPVSMDGIEDTVEEKLKAQRLNVGLSRAQEMMWFVLSKPVADFSGSIGTALRYYENQLSDAHLATAAQTDATSKMEPLVLNWLKQCPFVQRHQDAIRIVPQFPIGQYLRQLDKRYQHPAWKVDFLLIVETPKGPVEVVIEYDGFESHFRGASWRRHRCVQLC
jgi:AAA domain